MNNKKVKNLIKKVAKGTGLDEREVREEMEKAILFGYINPQTHTRWNNIFGEQILPTPEDFIVQMVKEVVNIEAILSEVGLL